MIEIGVSNNHNLDIQIDGLRLQAAGGKQVKGIIGLNFELFTFERPFERLPHARLLDGIQKIDNQVAAQGL